MIRHYLDYGDYMIDSAAQCKIDKLDCIQDRNIHTIEYVYDVDRRENIEVLK